MKSLLWKSKQNKSKKIAKRKGDNVEGKLPKFFINKKIFAQNILSEFFGAITQRLSIHKKTQVKLQKKIPKRMPRHDDFSFITIGSIKGISAHVSKRLLASMTVEASLVLPLFILFFLQVGSIMEMMRFHGRLEVALWEIGRETSLYGTAVVGSIKEKGEKATEKGGLTKGEMDQLRETVGNLALSYTYVKGRVENYLGKEYLGSAPIKNGKDGLQYVGSRILQENDQVELVVTYLAYPKWFLEKYRLFAMENHYVGRLWTGYDIDEGQETGYYLAENMDVFHRNRDCSHLRLRASRVKWESMEVALNAKGKKYRACKKCMEEMQMDYVWISPEGDCYHAKESCPGLKRTVREVSMEEALRYKPCSRCGK